MNLTFLYPAPRMYSGGVATVYEYANALAARGHAVTFMHGNGIRSADEITWFRFHPDVNHNMAGDLDDPSIPRADVIFTSNAPEELGLPVVFVLGHRMLPEQWERDSFRAACPKVCMAKWLTRVGERYGAPPEQMIYVPTGMNQDLFRVVTPLDQRPIDVALLYGAPHPAKGWDVGIAALQKVRAERPDLRVTTFSVPAPTIPVPEWMEFRLDPDRGELAETIYNSTKVFIQPSNHEGFGLTALEAMACGSALVTTDNGGSEDYATHDESALVVPPRNPDAMAAEILRLLDDQPLRHRIAAAGTAVAQGFTWERSGEMFERFLLDYVADPDRFRRPPTADLSLAEPN